MSEYLQTRREFLRRGVVFLATSTSAPFFLTRTVWALDQAVARAGVQSVPGLPDGRVLVVIQLGGGNDGLNTVIPYASDDYYRARPTLAVTRETVLKLNDTVGLHPGLEKFKSLYDRGEMAVIQGVGYPNPDRSHFRSMEIWQTADPNNKTVQVGWLGRYLDNTCPGCDPVRRNVNPLAGVSLGGGLPLALKSSRGAAIAVGNPEAFRWVPLAGEKSLDQRAETMFVALNRLVAPNLNNPHVARLEFLGRVALDAQLSSEQIRAVLRKTRNLPATYPASPLARQLKLVGQLIRGGLGTRVYYVSRAGFDTHANQRGPHERLLGELAEAVTAFQHDLREQGNQARVLTLTFSEFGRRVAENASGGTDHGTAAPLFVFGGRTKAGVYGLHPSLARDDLDHGDLKFHTDFRGVYATVLENWLGTPAAPILGAGFPKLAFV